MSRKAKNTLVLVILLIIIIVIGVGIDSFYLGDKINEKQDKLKKLKSFNYDTEQITAQLKDLSIRANVLDSLLASRRYNIPFNLSSIKFFKFINKLSTTYSSETKINVEFINKGRKKEFYFFEYKITGTSDFDDFFKTIYAIEHSKELKKIKNVTINNLISTDKNGIPEYLINYNILSEVVFADNDRFATKKLIENDLTAKPQYDIFYPLIRNEIPPNVDGLLDVQGARLLALIPEGAFLSDSNGKTFLLWEGEQVYLGYLTKINYEKNKVTFILNKGGIIENINLVLEKENAIKKTKQ